MLDLSQDSFDILSHSALAQTNVATTEITVGVILLVKYPSSDRFG
jgi:hypothetical protein